MSKPSHFAYVVTEYTQGTEKKSSWRKIGVAFTHKDGQGVDIVLEALPVSGRLTLRTPKPEEEKAEAEAVAAAAGKYDALRK